MNDISNVGYSTVRLDGERIMLVGGAEFMGTTWLECRQKGAEVLVVDNMQINNIVKVVSDPTLDDVRRRCASTSARPFTLLRDNGIKGENIDARQMAG